MTKLLLRRILTAVPLLLVVSFVVFLLVDMAPGDPAHRMAGDFADEEELAEVRARLELDRPLPVRYTNWLADVVHGDFGTSLVSNEPVTTRLQRAAPATASLVVGSMIMSTIIGVSLAVAAAQRPNGWVDRSVTALASLAIAVPPFWLALLLVLVFSVRLGWLPAVGFSPSTDGYGEWFRHLLLPSLTLSALAGAEITRQLRGSLVDVLEADYVLAARARGIPRKVVVRKHALKNAAAPVVTIAGYRLAQLVGGSVIVERAFAIRGLGSLSIDAALQSDLPVVLGIVVVSLLAVVAINTLVDLSYGYFSPKSVSR